MKRFSNDDPVQCDACGEYIYAGDRVMYYEGYKCHDRELCMKNILFLVHEDEFDEEYLHTAEDKECNEYDE